MNASALDGKVVLLTGAAGGLGAAVAGRLGVAGARLVLLDKNRAGLESLSDRLVEAGAAAPELLPWDLEGAGPDDYDEFAGALSSRFEALDILVHCAARFTALTPHRHYKPEEWLRTMQANLNGPWLLTQCCIPLLQASSAGRILFALDDPQRVLQANWGAYGVAKQALSGLISQLRDELSNSRIRVAGFNPGPMMTGLRGKAYMMESPQDARSPDAVAGRFVSWLAETLSTTDDLPPLKDFEADA